MSNIEYQQKLRELEDRIRRLEELRRMGAFVWKAVMWMGALALGAVTVVHNLWDIFQVRNH